MRTRTPAPKADVMVEPAIALRAHPELASRVRDEGIPRPVNEVRQNGLILPMVLPRRSLGRDAGFHERAFLPREHDLAVHRLARRVRSAANREPDERRVSVRPVAEFIEIDLQVGEHAGVRPLTHRTGRPAHPQAATSRDPVRDDVDAMEETARVCPEHVASWRLGARALHHLIHNDGLPGVLPGIDVHIHEGRIGGVVKAPVRDTIPSRQSAPL